MSIKIHDMRKDTAPPPPELAAHFGRRIRRAWVSKSGLMLTLRLTGGWIVMMEATRTDIPGSGAAISIEVAEEKDGAEWGFLDALSQPQAGHLVALRGKALTGFKGGTLELDERFGIQVTPEEVRFVMIVDDKQKGGGKR